MLDAAAFEPDPAAVGLEFSEVAIVDAAGAVPGVARARR